LAALLAAVLSAKLALPGGAFDEATSAYTLLSLVGLYSADSLPLIRLSEVSRLLPTRVPTGMVCGVVTACTVIAL
jgi:hypothetical protein